MVIYFLIFKILQKPRVNYRIVYCTEIESGQDEGKWPSSVEKGTKA